MHERGRGYSVRRLFTGLARAALMARKLTVSKAIRRAAVPARANIHQGMTIR